MATVKVLHNLWYALSFILTPVYHLEHENRRKRAEGTLPKWMLEWF